MRDLLQYVGTIILQTVLDKFGTSNGEGLCTGEFSVHELGVYGIGI